jgi:acyl-CoA synthetase (AMP-forming)/AMP-acid ligase II
MGLIGTVLNAITLQIELAVLSPRTFLRDPSLWLSAIERHRGTHTAAPNFAYGLCTKRIQNAAELDLSSMRVFICGAEPIAPATLDAFAHRFGEARLDPTAIVPAYGLAEATLAVSFTPYGSGMRHEDVDPSILGEERIAEAGVDGARALQIASCGVAMPGLEIRIGSDGGDVLRERQVGEIQVRGPSVTPGYVRDPEATAASRTADGWLRTGDLGYLAGGHLYPCGRTKDMIVVRGRNLFAHDLEALAGSLEGVRTGNVVAFGCAPRRGGDGERLVLVAESRELERADVIARAVRGAVCEAMGVQPDDVVIVAPGTLPKTSSGKLKRLETRKRYEHGTLADAGPPLLETFGVALRSGLLHVVNRVRAD